MAQMVVSASKGVIGPLLGKLTDLIGDKCSANLLGVSNDIVFLRDEMSTISVLLDKLQDTNELDLQVKNWRDQVREMSYDIEDCIDDFINKVGSTTDANAGLIHKVCHFLETLRAHVKAAMQIKKLKTCLHEISERRKRYKLFEDYTVRTALVDADPRLSALYKESTMLVGIEHQKKEITVQIKDGGEQLKVVPVVGFGGSGKTTLAKEVYGEVRGHFECTAFVSVSQKPDITQLLSRVISQLGLQQSSHAYDVQDHIKILREYLQKKRYLIVVDDLWNVLNWDIIGSSFPQNDKHSRVIVTTRIKDVARACCSDHGYIHNMEPLSEGDSRKLFLSRIFGSKAACPPQFTEIAGKILKKCGGLPLVIMTVASTIACSSTTQTVEQWEHIHNSLTAQFATNPTMETMIHILDLSYKNLPRHLKSCFLHLGIYPEDWLIFRSDVIRQWVAEGFVSHIHRQGVWDVAKSYFNELVNRSIIQPVGFVDDDVLSCRVHDMMLELITKRCREDNFIVVLRDPHGLAGMQGKVRRLSADFRGAEYGTMSVTSASRLSQVRSVAIFGKSKWVPTLIEFKFLRVLYVKIDDVFKIDLTCIGQLSQLRYLKVSCNHWYSRAEYCIVLPAQIRRLQQLETLELPADMPAGCTIPSDITDLPRLSHQVVPWKTRLPDGASKMKSLRTLRCPSLPKSTEGIKGLGELTNLVELTLDWRSPDKCSSNVDTTVDQDTRMAALSSSLEKLGKLKQFGLRSSAVSYSADALLRSSSGAPLHSLQSLGLSSWTFSRVPKWMAHLHNLYDLAVAVKQVIQEDIGIIGALPLLRTLDLDLLIPSGIPAERIVVGSTTGFMLLKRFALSTDRLSSLTFELGAMPQLQRLQLSLDELEWDEATPSGLEHLSSLEEIVVSTVYYDNDDHDIIRSENQERTIQIRTAFQEAAKAVPSRPAFAFWNRGRWRRRET